MVKIRRVNSPEQTLNAFVTAVLLRALWMVGFSALFAAVYKLTSSDAVLESCYQAISGGTIDLSFSFFDLFRGSCFVAMLLCAPGFYIDLLNFVADSPRYESVTRWEQWSERVGDDPPFLCFVRTR